MNKKQKIIVSIVGITIVLLALLGITYAYYLTRIQGNTNTNSISITTADLKLVYGDGNGLLTATNIMPGKQVEFKTTNNTTTTEKTFTVTNSGNSLVEGYAVSLDYAYIENVMPSIFERPEDFQITLTCSTNRTGETCNGFTGNFNNESIMMTSNDIEVGETHSYSLSIYYNDPGVDQSNDMNKNLNLKVQIYNISESTDIEGTITGVDSTYAVRIESEPKMSTIVNGKYNFKGIEIGTHTLTVLDEDGAVVDKEYIVVKSGTTPSITTAKTTIDNEEVDATGITITSEQRVVKLNTKVENSVLIFDTSTSSIEIFNPYSNNKNSLAYNIINSAVEARNTSSTTGTIYSSIPFTKPVEEISDENERTLSITTDDYGVSYYFRGNTNDNYVLFNNMCWRIVRIEGDGSVKLTLAGFLSNGETNCSNLGYASSIITGKYDPEYYGTLEAVSFGYTEEFLKHKTISWYQSNYTDGQLYSELDDWYQSNFINKSDIINKIKNEKWCLGDIDKKFNLMTKDEISLDYITDNIGKDNFFGWNYKSYVRAIIEKKFDLNCHDNDSYHIYPIGTLSVDEIFLAGAATSENLNYYLYQNAEQQNYWTLTKAYADCGEFCTDEAFCVYDNGSVSKETSGILYGTVSMNAGVRPAIVLKAGTTISKGTGISNNPYIIE